jgi:hypothetical protein
LLLTQPGIAFTLTHKSLSIIIQEEYFLL